jgi:hypothetical protein
MNRNGTAFENPHTTLTFDDVRIELGWYTYNFTSISDDDYGLTAYAQPSDISVFWYSEEGGVEEVNGLLWFILSGMLVLFVGIPAFVVMRRRK